MTADTECKIPYSVFPHIIEAILYRSDYKTKLNFRATCRKLRNITNTNLLLDTVMMYRTECPCGSLIVHPYKKHSYPFFKIWGELPWLISRMEGKKVTISDVDAGPRTNALLSTADSLSFTNHTRICNFVLESQQNFLGLHIDMNCKCGEGGLCPAFSHRAESVSIHLHPDNTYLTLAGQEGYYPTDIEVEKGDKTGCHMLQNVLNPYIYEFCLVLGAPISVDTAKHLPAFLFPKAHQYILHWSFRLSIIIHGMSKSGEVEKKAREAFALHLRIPKAKVNITFDQEAHPGP